VLAALGKGARTRAELARVTGLAPDLVDTALAHLVRAGRLDAEPLGSGCPTAGCGDCASGTAAGSAGCGAASPATARGPVAISLRLAPPPP